MHRLRIWPFLLALLTSCTLFDKMELTPAYVKVDRFALYDSTGRTLLPDQEVTEVWAYLDGIYIGTFGLPARFPVPVPENSQARLQLYAGVRNGRIEQSRVQYPFYAPDTSLFALQPGQEYSVDQTGVAGVAKITMSKDYQIRFEEDFEDPAAVKMKSVFRDIYPNTLNSIAFEAGLARPLAGGERYGRVSGQDGDSAILFIVQKNPLPLPANKDGYLELWYRSSHSLLIGIFASSPGDTDPIAKGYVYQELGLNPSPEWKKVYLYLGDMFRAATADNPTSTHPDPYEQFQITISGDSAFNSTDFLGVDNVRLMEYK